MVACTTQYCYLLSDLLYRSVPSKKKVKQNRITRSNENVPSIIKKNEIEFFLSHFHYIIACEMYLDISLISLFPLNSKRNCPIPLQNFRRRGHYSSQRRPGYVIPEQDLQRSSGRRSPGFPGFLHSAEFLSQVTRY